MKKLQENFDKKNEEHILPFLWIHGEDADTMCKELRHIYDSGIRSVCVEARPHKDFNGPQWFEDLGMILEECKRLGMQMWLLDDSHFPTGFANGEIMKYYPSLRKKYLCLKTYDFYGPIPHSGAVIKYALQSAEDTILGVYLQKCTGFEKVDPEKTIDVTASLHYVTDINTGKSNRDTLGRVLPGTQPPTPVVDFDLPEGAWSLNVLTVSYQGGEKQTEGYLNPLVPDAANVLLNAVYQPIYDHFSEEFGTTFQGFFSDEPRFGNIHGSEMASIGRNSRMNLPWCDDLPQMLASHCKQLGGLLAGISEDNLLPLLPLLFIGDNDLAHALRYAYMDLVSRLYSDHFDGRIADWCHAHHCRHIGHCIEDNEAASRLGYGAGHLFRAMSHADMAGIDVVLHQLMPGQDSGYFKSMHAPGWDGEFFTYLLGKLGGSLAHMDPAKKGQCMCELFGAYGWAEGNRLGKWLADHMLVRGVNVLVPHAFDCAPFPNADCPPHFCAGGHNPQYPEFRLLMDYCKRLCHLLSGGTACPDVALYFNAEGEWSGEYMATQKPASVLARNFIDYDLISADYLEEAEAMDGKLFINKMTLNALVLPWAQALPGSLLRNVLRLADSGVPVWFVAGVPERCSEGGGDELLQALAEHPSIHKVSLEELSLELKKSGIVELDTDEYQPYLRRYHYRQPDGEVYFFVNESHSSRIQTVVFGAKGGRTLVYNAFDNTLTEEPEAFTLDLPPYGSKVVIVVDELSEGIEVLPVPVPFKATQQIELKECTVALASMGNLDADGYALFDRTLKLSKPYYISTMEGYETFAGRIRYCFPIWLDGKTSDARLILRGVREGAKVTFNGQDCGTVLCGDYHFMLPNLKKGKNEIEVELNTTLSRAVNDFLSSFVPMEPTGLAGAVLELM